jgi:DNA mismatch repair protein MutS
VQQGYRVAICEQVEDPKVAKGIVRREVVETVSPGVAFADELLDGARNNFIAAISLADAQTRPRSRASPPRHDPRRAAASVVSMDELDAALARIAPRELLVQRGGNVCHAPRPRRRARDGARGLGVRRAMARDDLARQFGVRGVDGLGWAHATRHRSEQLERCFAI